MPVGERGPMPRGRRGARVEEEAKLWKMMTIHSWQIRTGGAGSRVQLVNVGLRRNLTSHSRQQRESVACGGTGVVLLVGGCRR